MHTDPIADMLTRIRNAQLARKPLVRLPASKSKRAILDVIVKSGFVKAVSEDMSTKFPELIVELDAEKKVSLTRISKPGRRIYQQAGDLKTVKNGLGISIVSTSQGMLTNTEAYKKGIGGELICEIY